LRVCDVTQFYAPRSGGVKRYLHEKQRYIQQYRPDDQHLLVVPGSTNDRRVAGNCVTCKLSSPVVPRSGGYRALLDLRAVGEIVERERPDIIECADPYQLGWYAARLSRMWRIPAVAFYHSHLLELPVLRRAPALVRRFVAQLYNQFACTLVASAALADALRDLGLRDVRVIELGIDTQIFEPWPNEPKGNKLRLLYVGRLAAEKNVRALFAAWERLPRERFELVVIGDGPLRGEVPPDAMHIRYCDDRRELARHYRAADLFVHPGLQETFGLAALEAQACGTPVIGFAGTRLDAVICHDQSAWPNECTASALAEGILGMSEMNRRGLGETAARRVRQRFAWPIMFARLFCVYAEVCEKYQPK
jgi:alpha-1,6-mannosyltransferase